MAASGRLSEVLSTQAATLLPGKGRVEPDSVQNEYTGKLVRLLRPFSIFEGLAHPHFLAIQASTIASSLLLGALPYVKAFIEQANISDEALSLTITENTLRPLTVPSSMTMNEFHLPFTGQNLWEFVGFLFACAGRSAKVNPLDDFLNANFEVIDCTTFVHQLMMVSNTCASLSR